jgi:hypothetical protein
MNKSNNIIPVYHSIRRKNLTFRMGAVAQLCTLLIGFGLLLGNFYKEPERREGECGGRQAVSAVRGQWTLSRSSPLSLLIVLESSMEQPYPFSPKDHLHRPRRASLSPDHDCTRTSTDQASPRAGSWTSWIVTCPTLGGRRRMAWTSAVGGRGGECIVPRYVSKEEEGCLVTLVMTTKCRA